MSRNPIATRRRARRRALGRWMATGALLALVPASGRAQSPWRYDHDVRLSYEFDDNVQEELEDPVRAQVAKLGYHGDILWGGGEQQLTIEYQGGFKQHFGSILREEDVTSQFVNEGRVSYLRKITPRLALGSRVGLKHRAWLDDFFFLNEDGFLRRTAGINAIVDLQPLVPEEVAQLELGADWTDYKWKHLDGVFGNEGLGAYATLTKEFGEDIEVAASYSFDALRYPGRKALVAGENPLNITAPTGERQEDRLHELGLSVSWFADVSVLADYRFRYSESNSFGFSHVSHRVGIQVFKPLPMGMLAHVVGQVELRSFLEPVPSVTAGSLDTDDSQNNVLLARLVKDITPEASIELRYARYRNEAITLNDFYTKNIWAVGVTYRP